MGVLARRRVEADCDVDLERTLDSFHAYAVPDGIAIRPGDVVQVHGMPSRLQFGEARCFRTTATVIRAGWLRRAWTRAASVFDLTSLYEVGFQPDEELVLVRAGQDGSKAFFSEEKKQKTFDSAVAPLSSTTRQGVKVFWFFFSKKNRLPFRRTSA